KYRDPLRFAAEERIFKRLQRAMHADLDAAMSVRPQWTGAGSTAYLLPDRPSSRRALGAFANYLAHVDPRRAHAVLAPKSDGRYVGSVGVPASAATGADDFGRGFPTGGGRRGAAGVDDLPAEAMQDFMRRFAATFG